MTAEGDTMSKAKNGRRKPIRRQLGLQMWKVLRLKSLQNIGWRHWKAIRQKGPGNRASQATWESGLSHTMNVIAREKEEVRKKVPGNTTI